MQTTLRSVLKPGPAHSEAAPPRPLFDGMPERVEFSGQQSRDEMCIGDRFRITVLYSSCDNRAEYMC
jgi:hypothetical protein